MKKSILLFLCVLISVFCLSVSVAYAEEVTEPTTQPTTQASSTLKDISKAKITVGATNYNGLEKTPTVKVVVFGKTLKKNVDYTVAYSDNINAGSALVTVTGIGDYTGTATKKFTINKLSFTKKACKVELKKQDPFVYKGEAKTPKVVVIYTINDVDTNLVLDRDYTVKYENNNSLGTAKIIVKGIGNFTDSKTITFKLIPSTIKGAKVSDTTTTAAKLSWNKIDGVTGYEILKYNTDKKTYEHYSNIAPNEVSTTISNLQPANTYKYIVKGYKTINKEKYYGKESKELIIVTKPSNVLLESVTKKKDSKKVVIKWKKVNCSNYELFYTTDKSFKSGIKTVEVGSSKTSYTIENIDTSKEYYVRIRAVKNSNDKVRYSEKSAILSTYFSNLYATYSSNYVNNPNRTANLRLASKAISGTIVQPGETFNFNAVVGPRTASRGYKKAHVFQGSNQVVEGIGGGICQVASTMFNCALKANVKIAERHQHSQRVAYVPLGRDAAIYGNVENFKWTNNTKNAIQIQMTVKNGVITCSFYTCTDSKPSKVKLNVSRNGNNFYLKRTVKGKVNYSCHSNY